MDYMNAYKTADTKLADLLAQHGLVHTFKVNKYPLTLVISRDASPEAQMALFENDESVSSGDARLIFTFPVDDIGVKTYGRLVMSDALMSKVKGLAKKMHKAYCEGAVACALGTNTDDDDEDEDDIGEDVEADESDEGADATDEGADDNTTADAFDEFFDDDEVEADDDDDAECERDDIG